MTALSTALGVLGGGALATWITAWYNRRHTEAQTGLAVAQTDQTIAAAAKEITGVATALLGKVAETAEHRESQLLIEVREARAETMQLKSEVAGLHRAVELLSEQIRTAGLTPVYPPPGSHA